MGTRLDFCIRFVDTCCTRGSHLCLLVLTITKLVLRRACSVDRTPISEVPGSSGQCIVHSCLLSLFCSLSSSRVHSLPGRNSCHSYCLSLSSKLSLHIRNRVPALLSLPTVFLTPFQPLVAVQLAVKFRCTAEQSDVAA